jgi:hypothetical protein
LSITESHRKPLTQIAAGNLDVSVLGQLTPPHLSLGGSLEVCSLQVVRFLCKAMSPKGVD